MCKFLRNFTIPILSKIEITIDFNGPEVLKNRMVNLFQTSSYQVILMIIVYNLHYNLLHSVMWVQQP